MMDEKVYKTIGGAGAWNIAIGIVVMALGVASGVILVVNGAKLLAGRSRILL